MDAATTWRTPDSQIIRHSLYGGDAICRRQFGRARSDDKGAFIVRPFLGQKRGLTRTFKSMILKPRIIFFFGHRLTSRRKSPRGDFSRNGADQI